jgi:integrase
MIRFPLLTGVLLRPQAQHRAVITDEKEFGGLLGSIDDFNGWPTLKAATRFTALTCTRPGEVRGAHRAKIDLEKAVWRIPGERRKMHRLTWRRDAFVSRSQSRGLGERRKRISGASRRKNPCGFPVT